jgi:hypothetical protein
MNLFWYTYIQIIQLHHCPPKVHDCLIMQNASIPSQEYKSQVLKHSSEIQIQFSLKLKVNTAMNLLKNQKKTTYYWDTMLGQAQGKWLDQVKIKTYWGNIKLLSLWQCPGHTVGGMWICSVWAFLVTAFMAVLLDITWSFLNSYCTLLASLPSLHLHYIFSFTPTALC